MLLVSRTTTLPVQTTDSSPFVVARGFSYVSRAGVAVKEIPPLLFNTDAILRLFRMLKCIHSLLVQFHSRNAVFTFSFLHLGYIKSGPVRGIYLRKDREEMPEEYTQLFDDTFYLIYAHN